MSINEIKGGDTRKMIIEEKSAEEKVKPRRKRALTITIEDDLDLLLSSLNNRSKFINEAIRNEFMKRLDQ